jgi:hypothetical protein
METPIAHRPGAFAKRLGVSRAFIYGLINAGVIIARKLGGATLIFDQDNADLRQRLPQLELHRKAG